MKNAVIETLEWMRMQSGNGSTVFKIKILRKVIRKRHGIEVPPSYLHRLLPTLCDIIDVVGKEYRQRIYRYPKS